MDEATFVTHGALASVIQPIQSHKRHYCRVELRLGNNESVMATDDAFEWLL